MFKIVLQSALCVVVLVAAAARADQPWTFGNNTRYLALGDSLAAGYGAMPATNGYTYQLYQQGVFDKVSNTLFANAAMPGATSEDVLHYQVPQVHHFLSSEHPAAPTVITLSVGGNDLIALLNDILNGPPVPDVPAALFALSLRLEAILAALCSEAPAARIYIGNLYTIHNFPVSTDDIVAGFNFFLGRAVANANAPASCNGRVRIADVFAAFGGTEGPQQGLLLVNRNGAGRFEVHPTNAGYRAMASAYKAAHAP